MIIIQPSASRTTNPRGPAPSSKLLGYYHRQLCGLITLLFGQSQVDGNQPFVEATERFTTQWSHTKLVEKHAPTARVQFVMLRD
jgi:hypothetical protein